MARPLSFQSEPWQVFEVTTRCIHGRFLLTPSTESNRRVLGVLGRALEVYGEHVRIHMVAGTSNHLHFLISSRDAAWRARFKAHVKTNLSKELGDLHGWTEHLFGRRARDIPVLDDAALLDRVRYFLAHGVKEGLVARPEDWPGPAWVRALTAGEQLVGVWYRRTDFYHRARCWARRKEPDATPRPMLEDFGEEKVVKLEPLPIWAGLPPEERAARFQAIVDDIVAETGGVSSQSPDGATMVIGTGRPTVGVDAILRQDPHRRPERSVRRIAPWVHATCAEIRESWMEAYRSFVAAWRSRMHGVREGAPLSTLPGGGVLVPPVMALVRS